jgi:hypothetical protein
MPIKEQHVVPHGKNWGVRGEGNKRLTVITPTKGESENIGRDIARNQRTELVIHDRHGRIQDEDSYGNDPCPPRDKKH